MKFFMKKPKETPKSNADSNDDFPSDEIVVPKKSSVNGKTSKKMFVTLTVMIAWMVALTVVLLIFILENSKGKLEDRVRTIEAKTSSGKIGGKIIVPESNVISELQNRVANLETGSGAGSAASSATPVQIDNQILAGINDRLKKVEEKVGAAGPVAKGDAGAKTNQGEAYSELKERIDKLESLITKAPVSAQKTPKETAAKTTEGIVTAKKEVPRKTAASVKKKPATTKKREAPVRYPADLTARQYDSDRTATRQYDSARTAKQYEYDSRGFMTQPTGGYQPVTSGAGTIHQLGNHYDSTYNRHLDDLRGFSSRTLDESLQAGKTIYIPTGGR